ncbi:MAG: hypothetical protein HYW26_03555 [Candidatus Aenigmarchaeota archaeon]|nr:hypothetical protein [Candidatus Aenigmarchaeota archaeon]
MASTQNLIEMRVGFLTFLTDGFPDGRRNWYTERRVPITDPEYVGPLNKIYDERVLQGKSLTPTYDGVFENNGQRPENRIESPELNHPITGNRRTDGILEL